MRLITPKKNTEKRKSQSEIFNKFAKYYDQIYYDKNYEKECKFVISFLKKKGIKKGGNILDLGCGTGGHSIILRKKGFNVTGIDNSKIALEQAKKKFQKANLYGEFLKKDITNFNLNKKFDACVSMFSTFCYLTEAREFKKTIKNVNKHLKRGGQFIFDYWNGNAVINQKPSKKIKISKHGKRKIIRIATPNIDYLKQICTIEYHCKVIENNSIIDEFKEFHKIRYHFTSDLINYLSEGGFRVDRVLPIDNSNFNDNNKLFLRNWYLYVIATKR